MTEATGFQDSGTALLERVVEHYARCLARSESAQLWLSSHGISKEIAGSFRLGFCDRSYGNTFPKSNRLKGKAIREELMALGILRQSGHESLRGCLTVPICCPDGGVRALYGIRIGTNLSANTPRETWTSSCVGLFNSACLGAKDLVVVPSIPIALSLLSGGLEGVVAPGGPDPLGEEDVDQICAGAKQLVVVRDTTGDTDLASVLSSRVPSQVTVDSWPLQSLCRRVADALSSTERPHVSGVPADARTPTANLNVLVADGELHMEYPARSWRIRGATRSKGFESLRANVMVSDRRTGRFHVDTIDLYSSRQRGAFVSVCAEELGASVPEIASEIGKALLQTEQAADAGEGEPLAVPLMSDSEREEAMAMLTEPDLVARIGSDITSLGIVGEEDNALFMYLALLSRKSGHPLSVVVQSSSASGKSTLADALSSLVPEEDVVSYSALTGQALYYLGASDLAHKVLCIAEEQGASEASYAIKLLMSQGRLAIASTSKDKETAKLVTRSYEVKGPVSLLMTTTAQVVDEELASRLVCLTVTESPDQTRAIHEAQRAAYSAEGLVRRSRREQVLALHHNAQRLVDPLPVVIPMAEELDYPEATTRSRRDHDKYLSLIAASALLHQHQRVRRTTADGAVSYVEATWADVELAGRLARGVIIRADGELPPATASVLEALFRWAKTSPFTRREAREALSIGDTQLKVHLARLVELEYVIVTRRANRVTYQLAWSAPGERTWGSKDTRITMRSGGETIRSGCK